MADNVEFVTARARVLILSQFFPEYSASLLKAMNYAKNDPSAGLLKCRQILEDICKTIWQQHNNSPAPSIYDIFNDDDIKSNTPKRVLSRVHSLRTLCNLGVHGEEVTDDDVLVSLSHLFVLFDWYNVSLKNLTPLPVAVQPTHSFYKYMKNGSKNLVVVFTVLLFVFIPAIFFTYHKYLPLAISRPFKTAYEGAFLNLYFSLVYSSLIVLIASLLSWYLFIQFREQNIKYKVVSFLLMYSAVFGLQYLLLHILDYYTQAF